jgi:ribosome maturation factor RimP
MLNKEDITNICKSALSENQFLVEVKITPGNDIFVSVDDFNGLSIEECQRISRHIESQLDRETEDFSLEVGSPGLSNPFKVFEQYQKHLGKEVEVLMKDGEKHAGTLSTASTEEIMLSQTYTAKMANKKQQISEIIKIRVQDIKSTRSVISFK